MNFQRIAELEVILEGIPLPATRVELVAYTAREDPSAAADLAGIPDVEYYRIDAVGEALRPHTRRPEQRTLPREESGAPPGGVGYVGPRAGGGAVRFF